MKAKYITIPLLKEINNKSYNRKLENKFINSLPSDLLMPLHTHMMANEDSIRCKFVYNEKGNTFTLDMSIKDFNELPYVNRD